MSIFMTILRIIRWPFLQLAILCGVHGPEDPVLENVPIIANSQDTDIRAMSFNVRFANGLDGMNHWNFRRGMVHRAIRNFDPDILATQEAQHGQLGMFDQVKYLKDHLPEYSMVAVGNDGNRKGQTNAIFYKTSKFTLVDAGNFYLSDTHWLPSTTWRKDSIINTMCTWVKLQSSEHTYLVASTHFHTEPQTAKAKSAQLVASKMKSLGHGAKIILMGDFNTWAGGIIAKFLLQALSLQDTYRVRYPVLQEYEATGNSFREKTKSNNRVDWIFTDRSLSVVDAGIDYSSYKGKWPSDHWPVYAVLRD